jgi:hypothetical protein
LELNSSSDICPFSLRDKSSEIFLSFFGCHQEFLLDNLRRGRPFSHEGELEVVYNPALGSDFIRMDV